MRKLPPLGELRAFEAAARHLSFKLAAEELAVTPTAVSHQIKLLEEFCGCKLFRRRPRPLALTDEGATLFPTIRDGMDAFAESLNTIRDDEELDVLKVTATEAFASNWLVPRLSLWQKQHLGIAIEVNGTQAVLDLDRGGADLAIRYMYAAPTDFQSYELLRDTFIAVCSPILLSKGQPLTLAELKGHTLIHAWDVPADSNAPTWKRWLDKASAQHEVPKLNQMQHMVFTQELNAIEAAVRGQGVLVIGDVLVEKELQNGTLVKAMDFTLPGYGFYIIHKRCNEERQIAESFLEWLKKVI